MKLQFARIFVNHFKAFILPIKLLKLVNSFVDDSSIQVGVCALHTIHKNIQKDVRPIWCIKAKSPALIHANTVKTRHSVASSLLLPESGDYQMKKKSVLIIS